MFIKRLAPILLTIILGTSFALSLGAMKDDTATFDERAHIPAAYSYVRYGDMRLNPEHPPLLKDLAGLPLLFLHLNFPIESDLWTNGITKDWQYGTTMWSTWGLGTLFLYQDGNDAESILFWSRLPLLILTLLLGFFVYRATKDLAGTGAGLFAALLFAFDPNVLAHGHLVTTDVGIATFIFIAVYYFIKFLKEPSPYRIFLAGFTLGLAELAKFSAAILVPLFFILAFLAAFTKEAHPSADAPSFRFRLHAFRVFGIGYLKILILAFALIWIGYALNTSNMPAEKTILHANLVFAGDAPAKVFARNTVVILAQQPFLAPIAHYTLGVFMVFSRVTGGNSFYFLGSLPEHAMVAYFPIVFFLKEPLPFGFLLVFSILYTIFRCFKPRTHHERSLSTKRFNHWFQARIPQITMLSFVILYTALSIFGNLNIGFRHLFPILPFAFVLTSATIFSFMRNRSNAHRSVPCSTRQLYRILTALFVFWIVVIPFIAYPKYLSYYNEVVGATNGRTIAVDSNYDWGQNLKRLKIWVNEYNRQHPSAPINHLNIDYYGGSEVNYYFPESFYTAWHSSDAPKAGWFAISATFFEENTHKTLKDGETDYSWLLKYQPLVWDGDSLLLFYVSPESLEGN